jgi:hypothetical protein
MSSKNKNFHSLFMWPLNEFLSYCSIVIQKFSMYIIFEYFILSLKTLFHYSFGDYLMTELTLEQLESS